MAYRCWTHVALAVGPLPEAEEFYARLFGMAVAFREAEVTDGWRTLREGGRMGPGAERRDRSWAVPAPPGRGRPCPGDSRHRARRPRALPRRDRHGRTGTRRTAGQGRGPDCHIVTDRDGLLVFDDPYGVRWEATTATALASTAARTGRWLDLPV